MIEIKNVTKSYNGKTKAVDDITLQIKNGEIFGFLGPKAAITRRLRAVPSRKFDPNSATFSSSSLVRLMRGISRDDSTCGLCG